MLFRFDNMNNTLKILLIIINDVNNDIDYNDINIDCDDDDDDDDDDPVSTYPP